jgi:Leucine-rich repeat (LRR) protein
LIEKPGDSFVGFFLYIYSQIAFLPNCQLIIAMKKLLPFILLISSIAGAQIVNIPDGSFKVRLLSAGQVSNTAFSGGVSVPIDTNNDSEIQVSEAQVIDSLNVSIGSIEDLTGISAFTNLKSLNCSQNQLTALDLSALTGLKKINFEENQVGQFDVLPFSNLEELLCSRNQLTALNLTNSSALKKLGCAINNLTALDLSNLIALEYLDCMGNNLTSLDASVLTTLKRLYCGSGALASLNVAGLAGLEWLICDSAPLGTIDTTGLSGLQYFACTNCGMTTLDITGLDSIIELNCARPDCIWHQIPDAPGILVQSQLQRLDARRLP